MFDNIVYRKRFTRSLTIPIRISDKSTYTENG